jgi:hypothetical protein
MNAGTSAIQGKKLSGERIANPEKMSECPALSHSTNTKNTKDASNSRKASNSEKIRHKRDPVTARMRATAGTQATAVTPATRNNRNDSSNRSASTVGMPTKAGTLAKVVKPATACRKANYSRDTIYIRVTAAGLPESEEKSYVATVEKLATCSRDTGCQMPQMPETMWPQATTMSFRRNKRKILQTFLFASPVVKVR